MTHIRAGAFLALVTLTAQACSQGDAPAVDAGSDTGKESPAVTSGSGSSSTPGTGAGSGTGTGTSAMTGSGTGTTPPTGSGTEPAGDAGAPETSDATAPSGAGVVINEINGKEVDYVELYNAGSTPVDLSGWGVTEAKDTDAGTTGNPKTPYVFASGTTLASQGYIVVLGAPKDGGTPSDVCPSSTCVIATWNISTTNGATVYLLDTTSTAVETESFPKEITSSGQSWGRLPNGTGSFTLNTQTPGSPNAGP